MIQVTIAEAQARLPELLAMIQAGEGMEIYAESGWIFRVGAIPPNPPTEEGRPKSGFRLLPGPDLDGGRFRRPPG